MREETDTRTSAAGLARAALLGLCGGLLVGGGYLLSVGLRALYGPPPVECAALPEAECAFLLQTLSEMARRQLLAGAALVTLGVALALLARPSRR